MELSAIRIAPGVPTMASTPQFHSAKTSALENLLRRDKKACQQRLFVRTERLAA